MAKSISHDVDGVVRNFVIRSSMNDDIAKIYEWLKEEDSLGVEGNFLCNWGLTEQCHREGSLLVLVDELEGIPVAYQWGQVTSIGHYNTLQGTFDPPPTFAAAKAGIASNAPELGR